MLFINLKSIKLPAVVYIICLHACVREHFKYVDIATVSRDRSKKKYIESIIVVISTRSMLHINRFCKAIDWFGIEYYIFYLNKPYWIKDWNRLIVVIDWNSIRWMWSISNNLNESMMSMKYVTDTVYYEWYYDDVAILVDRSGKKR